MDDPITDKQVPLDEMPPVEVVFFDEEGNVVEE